MALFQAEVFRRSMTMSPLASRAKFAGQSASSSPGMPDCSGTQCISVSMPRVRRTRTIRLFRSADSCPWPSSWCAVLRIAACESLKTAFVFALCSCRLSLLVPVFPSAGPIAYRSTSKTSIGPVPRQLRHIIHGLPSLPSAAAPTRRSSERDESVHYIQTPAPTIASFSLTQCCAALLAMLLFSSIMVLTTGASPGACSAHGFGCPAVLVFSLDYKSYQCAGRGVLVLLLQSAAVCVC